MALRRLDSHYGPSADSLKATELILVAFLMQDKWNTKELRRIISNFGMII